MDDEGNTRLPTLDSALGDDWKKPVGVLSVFTLIGFILGCVSTDMAKNNAKAIYKLETDPVPSECVFGDQLFGETLYEAPQHSHSHYQIVGVGSKSGESASITWAEAFADAKSRCYNGHPGYLAMIGSQAENDFVQGLITAHPTYTAGDDGWLGAVDFDEEGTYAWLGPQKLAEGIVFYKVGEGPTPADAYTNWAENEPNEGGLSGKSEDCVAMYGGGGKWYDHNCYLTRPFFVVEFGAPTVDHLWNEEHDDAVNDDSIS